MLSHSPRAPFRAHLPRAEPPSAPLTLEAGEGQGEDRAEAEEKLEDLQLCQKDLVKGLVRMDLLPRLRYLLEVKQLAEVADVILDMLIRIARHSMERCDDG